MYFVIYSSIYTSVDGLTAAGEPQPPAVCSEDT